MNETELALLLHSSAKYSGQVPNVTGNILVMPEYFATAMQTQKQHQGKTGNAKKMLCNFTSQAD